MGPVTLLALTFFTTSTLSGTVEQNATQNFTDLPIQLYQISTENKQKVAMPQLPTSYLLQNIQFVSQSYNNCGPAALSMVFSHYGKMIDQETLAQSMRPFNNPNGGIDDKSVFPEEFVNEAKKQGFEAIYRPNGNKELVKQLIANDIPVVIRTWLNPIEDIGHYRIIKGFDDTKQLFIQDDSYQGSNLTYSYDEVMAMWQPFSYAYIIVYPKEKETIVKSIIGDNIDEKKAWANALIKAKAEKNEDATNPYPAMNAAMAYYHLGSYKEAIQSYEEVKDTLPSRMLWYQPEPLYAYQKSKNAEEVFRLSDQIIQGGNPAFSELYQLRGEIYMEKGDKALAKSEFENALFYNNKFTAAQKALEKLL